MKILSRGGEAGNQSDWTRMEKMPESDPRRNGGGRPELRTCAVDIEYATLIFEKLAEHLDKQAGVE